MSRARYWDDEPDEGPSPPNLEYERQETARVTAEREQQWLAQEAAIRASAQAWMKEANRRYLLREYQVHGLEPVYADKAKTIMLSLSMLLAMGWKIEEIEGVKVLTKPTKETADDYSQTPHAGR